mmetsp:Transcript_34502/g.47169  ORF Transcript_34502/g.47169 Transcript_34502/m.47169 type:complete len:94 (+) Transcript_34502:497-778(+)
MQALGKLNAIHNHSHKDKLKVLCLKNLFFFALRPQLVEYSLGQGPTHRVREEPQDPRRQKKLFRQIIGTGKKRRRKKKDYFLETFRTKKSSLL